MEAAEQVLEFGKFFEKYYSKDIMDSFNDEYHSISVDFEKLAMFNVKLSELLLESPETTLKAAELAIQNMGLPDGIEEVKVRFENLPESVWIKISHVRTRHLEKFLKFKGLVKTKSEIRPMCTSATFECPSCGNLMDILQTEKKFQEPQMCNSCGRKGKFKLSDKKLIDAQILDLEESHDEVSGSTQPKKLKMILYSDLVSPFNDKKTNPGMKVEVNGILREIPIEGRSGARTVNYDLLIEGNNCISLSEDFDDIVISEEEEEQIKQMAKDPDVYNKLIHSLCPTIYGYEKVKEALVLQLFGGSKKMRPDGVSTRGDMHVLLIGDPGAGKSQIMKRMSVIAPKSKFVSGKGTTGAGLTASVVRDEMTGSWSLEAGAMVLANNGFCFIDEMDKMTNEDRSAMHEALEQQCYHHDTIMHKADGSEFKIGEFVDNLFQKYPERIIEGHKCQILNTDDLDNEMLTTDWKTIFKTKIDRVSRHLPEDHYVKLTLCHGRSIIVTPEHPVFVIVNGDIKTKRADQIKQGDWCPTALNIPIEGETQFFDTEGIYNERAQTHITVPESNCEAFYKMLGYFISEGAIEKNRGKLIGINVTNKDKDLLDDFENSMNYLFNLSAYRQERVDHNESRWMSRYTSTELCNFLQNNVPEILTDSKNKQIPQLALKAKKSDLAIMLSCLFEGDGHASVKTRTIRIGYSTISKRLAEQVQDLLLRFQIRSNLTNHGDLYKVSITGYDNIFRFNEHIGFRSKRKTSVVDVYLETNNYKLIRSRKDVIPTVYKQVVSLLTKYEIKQVGNYKVYRMREESKKQDLSINRRTLENCIIELKKKPLDSFDAQLLDLLSNWVEGDIGFEKVKSTEIVIDNSQKWTYDVTIEPNHTFISQAMVLHNTVTVSKANIQATLKCETTVLAAANPKFGRFDPYAAINDQIDLPPALISRFDLIFPIKDVPDRFKDDLLADFILKIHKTNDYDKPDLETEFMTKYIAYARKHSNPILTDDALNEIKKYYVEMRSSGVSEDGSVKGIAITTRQLEGLIRLAEASAKTRLSETVEFSDARKAIDLLHHCLGEIALDKETGKIDIDKISSVGISQSQRSKIMGLNQVIKELEDEVGKVIPVEDILKKAQSMGIESSEVEEGLEKLKRTGDIYEPKRGFYSRL